jgi:squalene-associated FAD-dependent desaturase
LQDTKIAIIGAGVSGLSAAVALVERGFRNITIFEARKEAGGRTRSYIDPTTGDVLDNGQHLLLGCYRATLKYLKSIGSDHLLHRTPLLIHYHEAGRKAPAILQIPPSSKPPVNLLGGLWSSKLLTKREKIAATWLGLAIDASSAKNAEGMTCEALFQKLHQPSGLVKKFWEPIVLATINASIKEASAVLFVNVLREAFLSGKEASDLLIPSVGLSELLIDPAIRRLEKNGARILLSSPVRAIEKDGSNFKIVTDHGDEEFDAVIYTGQSSEALPQEVRSSIPEFEYSPIVNAYFWLDREIFSTPVHSFLATTLQWAFPKPSLRFPQRLALTVSAANGLVEHSNDEIQHILWVDLCAAVPAARLARLLHFQIIREKRATPLITPSLQKDRPGITTRVPNLWLAGDIVQNGLPATIEGAVRNGYAVTDGLGTSAARSVNNF